MAITVKELLDMTPEERKQTISILGGNSRIPEEEADPLNETTLVDCEVIGAWIDDGHPYSSKDPSTWIPDEILQGRN